MTATHPAKALHTLREREQMCRITPYNRLEIKCTESSPFLKHGLGVWGKSKGLVSSVNITDRAQVRCLRNKGLISDRGANIFLLHWQQRVQGPPTLLRLGTKAPFPDSKPAGPETLTSI